MIGLLTSIDLFVNNLSYLLQLCNWKIEKILLHSRIHEINRVRETISRVNIQLP